MLRRSASVLALTLLTASTAVAQTFANSAPITIPSFGPAIPYPSSITVSGVTTGLKLRSLVLYSFSHTWMSDIEIALVDVTNNRGILLTHDLGGSADLSNNTIDFRDSHTDLFGTTGGGDATTSATYLWRPLGGLGTTFGALFDGFLPTGITLFDTFDAMTNPNPNATYALYINDDAGGDQGTVRGGWAMTFGESATVVPEPSSLALLVAGLVGTMVVARRRRA